MPRVFVERRRPGVPAAIQIREALDFLDWKNIVPSGATVFVKPNLTWRTPSPGVTTTPAFIEACIAVLRERAGRIIIGEADGGYHGFRAEEAFESHGVYRLCREFGIEALNLTHSPTEKVTDMIAGKRVSVDLPLLLTRETDVFITLPVPKIHAATRVSLAFKNQWGCLPSPMRLHHHSQFARKVILINRTVRTRIALFDATYMLDRTGPMIGDPIRSDLILASDTPGAGSLAACRLMGIDPWSVAHHRVAQKEGMMPAGLDEVILNQPLDPFCSHQFRLKRNLMNWLAVGAFRSELLTRLAYDSTLADISHRLLYALRRRPLIGKLLYGKLGPPEIEGHREVSS